MKLLVPICSPEETEDLIKAGADELYCGLFPVGWKKKYTVLASPNKREYHRANLSSWTQLKEIVNCASSYNVKVFLTVNIFYSNKQYSLIASQIEKAASLGVGGLMVADYKLLYLLNKMKLGIPVHASTIDTVFNSESVQFLKSLGIADITLPRDLSLNEIKGIVLGNPGIRFGVFVINDACKNTDGFCTFLHAVGELKEPSFSASVQRLNIPCYFDYNINSCKGKKGKRVTQIIKTGFKCYNGAKICAACFLSKFKEWGVETIKIAGRQNPKETRIQDVRFMKSALRVLESRSVTEQKKASGFMKEFFGNIYAMKCNKDCYYA